MLTNEFSWPGRNFCKDLLLNGSFASLTFNHMFVCNKFMAFQPVVVVVVNTSPVERYIQVAQTRSKSPSVCLAIVL